MSVRGSRFLPPLVTSALVVLSSSVLTGPTARAEDAPAAPAPGAAQKACTDAYISNQRLRKAGKLTEAHHELLICVQQACPSALRVECQGWLEELEKNLPTIVVGAQAHGQDVIDVNVSVDGAVVKDKLDGLPIPLDPGAHELSFERGGKSISQRIVVQEGVKNRPVNVSFDRAEPEAPAATSSAPSAAPGEQRAPVPALGPALPRAAGHGRAELYAGGVLAGLTAVGLGAWIGVGLAGRAKASDLENTCGPSAPPSGVCQQGDIDAAHRLLVGADAAMGVTLALAAASAGLFIHYAVSSTPSAEHAGTHWTFMAGPGYGSATLSF